MTYFTRTYLVLVLVAIFNLGPVQLAAQENAATQPNFSRYIQHFYDATKQSFVVISNDSSYSIYNEEQGIYERKKLNFNTDSTFQHFLKEFIPVSTTTNGTFFVHMGCGVVYHFISDSIYRHDQSFYHKNQYSGVVFEQHNEIFMYGGYGMFTEKNILVHYNQFMREWVHVEYVNDEPSALQYPFLIPRDNFIYSLSGLNQKKEFNQNDVQRFDFTSKQWEKIGTVTETFFNNGINLLSRNNPYDQLDVLVHNDRIIRTDVKNNFFNVYSVQPVGGVLSIKSHPTNSDQAQVHFQRTGVKSYFVKVMKWEELLGQKIATGAIWNPPSRTAWFTQYGQQITTFIIGALLMWVLLFLHHRKKSKRLSTTRIDFHKLDLQDDQFIALQQLFLTASDYTIQVSAINPIVEEDGITPDTIKKRRERLIKEFTTSVAIQTGLDPTEIFLEMRHPKDKRIKLLQLNNKLIINH